MLTTFDKNFYLKQLDQFKINLSILLKEIEPKTIRSFLKNYNLLLFEELDLFINDILLESELIDLTLFKRLQESNFIISQLALITELELAQELECSVKQAHFLRTLFQFHYSNKYKGISIYYTSFFTNFSQEIEKKEIGIIKLNFKFCNIINASLLNQLWKNEMLTEEQILERCSEIISQADIFIFSANDKNYINEKLFFEISLAQEYEKQIYLVYNNKLSNFSLGDKIELNSENYCAYKPIPIYNERMVPQYQNINLEDFIKTNFNEFLNNFHHDKKYIIVCNNTNEIDSAVRLISTLFKSFEINILPIIGKKSLCRLQNEHLDCQTCRFHNNMKDNKFFGNIRGIYFENIQTNLYSAIKKATLSLYCSYDLIYKLIDESNVIILNKIFFQALRLRFNLIDKIIKNNYESFIPIFNNISDLGLPYKEGSCSKLNLNKIIEFIKTKNVINKDEAISLLNKLINLGINDHLDVELFLREFLKENYQNFKEVLKEYNEDFQKSYEICKSPFGVWKSLNGSIYQNIQPESFYNFLNNFTDVYFLNSKAQDKDKNRSQANV